jgi:HipA-like kinase
MLELLSPFQFDRPTGNGRTKPARLTCEGVNDELVEVVVKVSANCDRGVTSLAMEAFSACMAADLNLPVPKAYLVDMEPDWIASIVDEQWAQSASQSSSIAFGSKSVRAGYSEWISGTLLGGLQRQSAAAIMLFDALIDNPDRREDNPNCLVKGEEFRIIDHELAFPDTSAIIGWQPPWTEGGLHHLETNGRHIFRGPLQRREIDWNPIRQTWIDLSDARLSEYVDALPLQWSDATEAVEQAVNRVKGARENIDNGIAELIRILQ